MTPFRLLIPALVALAASPLAIGQQLTVSKVTFRNAGTFRQADLEAVAQMHSGSKVSLDDIRVAAQRLVDTGFFEDVNVDSDHVPSALTVIFILKPLPADQVTKAEFENFVWLTPEELKATVHTVVPLFAGELPESGTSLDQIDAALKAALVAKGVTNAEVSHLAVLATTAEPLHTLRFQVLRPRVVVNSVHVEGGDPELQHAVETIRAKLTGSRYSQGEGDTRTVGRLLVPYRNAGFLEASVADVHVDVIKSTSEGAVVDVTGKLSPGAPYKVKSLHLADIPLISGAAIMEAAKLHPGDVASREALLATLAPVDLAYKRQGYLDEYVNIVPSLDTATHTVDYECKVVAGGQYRVRNVSVLGLPPDVRAHFDSLWKLNPGELYNPVEVGEFYKSNAAMPWLAGYAPGFKAASDPEAHVVDLMVNFVRVAGKT